MSVMVMFYAPTLRIPFNYHDLKAKAHFPTPGRPYLVRYRVFVHHRNHIIVTISATRISKVQHQLRRDPLQILHLKPSTMSFGLLSLPLRVLERTPHDRLPDEYLDVLPHYHPRILRDSCFVFVLPILMHYPV